jgi:hypothetical protein
MRVGDAMVDLLTGHDSHNSGGNQDLRVPENPEQTTNGLDFSYYHGEWNQLPKFDSLNPIESGIILNFDSYFKTQNDRFGFSYQGFY